jgi:flagellar biosynthesis anti-sigma factor FlgM
VKINDTRTSVPLNPESKTTAGGKGVSQNNTAADAKAPSSAVNLSVNPALVQAAQTGSAAASMSEAKALDEIRRLINKGEYKIDFPKVAENMLRDALAAIDSKKSS